MTVSLGSFLYGSQAGRMVVWTLRLMAAGSFYCLQSLLLFAETLVVQHDLCCPPVAAPCGLFDLQPGCLCGPSSVMVDDCPIRVDGRDQSKALLGVY